MFLPGSSIRHTSAARWGGALGVSLIVAATAAAPAGAAKSSSPIVVPSSVKNTVFGGYPIGHAPAATVAPGREVTINTLTQSGITTPGISPTEFFGKFGVKASEILPDMTAFWKSLAGRERYGPHVLTGPVDIRGAEPGDTLEVQVLALETRAPWGLNSTGPESGVFSTTYPGFRPGDAPLDIPVTPADVPGGIVPGVRQHLLRTGLHKGKEVTFFNKDIKVPLKKFMGVMGVKPENDKYVGATPTTPPPANGIQNSIPPGPYGGNLDIRDLGVGVKLYLPVFQKGAGFYVGDPHSVQGNGEVSGTANEQSLAGTFRFIVHKRKSDGPFAEDDKNLMFIGIDHDLDRAMKFSTKKMIDWLVKHKGLTTAKAYSLASIAGDFQVSEVVDQTQVVTGKLSKRILNMETAKKKPSKDKTEKKTAKKKQTKKQATKK